MKKLALALALLASVAHADIPVHDDMDFQNASTIINVLSGEITTLQIPEPGPGPQFTSFVSPSLTANVAYTLPPDDGDAGEQLQTDGSGTLTWEPAGDEILVNAVAASSPTDFNDTTPAAPAGGQNVDWQLSGASVSAHLQLDAIETHIIADSADDTDLGATSFPWNEIFVTTLRVHEAPGSGTNRSTFTQPAIGADIAYTLPVDDGDANEKLQTNGSGVLSWEPDVDTGDEITINTASVTGPVDFDDATPAAPAGGQNVDWQTSGSDVSAHLQLDAIETHILPDSADDTDLGATSFPWNEVFLTTLRIHEAPGSGTNRSTFTQPALAGDLAYTLPTDDGDAGEQLQTNGSGVLSWESPGGASAACIDNDSDGTCEVSADSTDEIFFNPDDNAQFDAKIVRSSGFPQIILHDSDLASTSIDSFRIENPCPTIGAGSEDCDVYFYSLGGGSAKSFLAFIGDVGGLSIVEFGGTSVHGVIVTTDGTGDLELTVPNDSITLTTETNGDYLASIASEANDGITHTTCSGAEGANCDLDLDIDDLTSFSTGAVDDELAVSDTSDSGTEKRITVSELIHDTVVVDGGTFSGTTAISTVANTNIVSATAVNTNGRAVFVICTVTYEKTTAGNTDVDFFVDLDGSNVATWTHETEADDDPNTITYHYANATEGSADTNTYSCQAQAAGTTVNALTARITVMAF